MGRISLGFGSTFEFQPILKNIYTSSYTHTRTQYISLHMGPESGILKA